VNVSVSDDAAADIARRLRATGVGYVFDRDEESHLIERILRELRWVSGLPAGRQRALKVVSTEARHRLRLADLDDKMSDYQGSVTRLAKHPGDAWEYHTVTIQIDEEADQPFYG